MVNLKLQSLRSFLRLGPSNEASRMVFEGPVTADNNLKVVGGIFH